MEPDLPGIIADGGNIGLTQGVPELLAILDEFHIKADFFFLASVARDNPDLVEQVAQRGHDIGNHGIDHSLLCAKPLEDQRRDIVESTRILEDILSARPTMFRAPNFSVNLATLRILKNAGYQIDSSVLPGRYVNRFRILRVYDHRNLPHEQYHPLGSDRLSGGNGFVEIPVTANPLQPGTPVGLGALNRFGTQPVVDFLRVTALSTVIFLVHPWEATDLSSIYPFLPRGYAAVCSSNLQPFRNFLQAAGSIAEFSTLRRVAGLNAKG